MRRLLAAMKKEMLLLVRDGIGLSILFIMPMLLIFVMTLIQDAAFRTLNEQGIPVVFINKDQDTLGNRIEQGLKDTELCDFHTRIDGEIATEESARTAIKEGKFLIGIIIPEGATDAIEDNIIGIVSESMGDPIVQEGDPTQAEIKLIIDPVASKSFITTITSQLREFISSVKTRIMFETFKEEIGELIPAGDAEIKDSYAQREVITYDQEYASELTGEAKPNSVQHNVPAWTIFAMFFIVIPIVGSVMKEKQEGSVFRFHTIPASYFLQINAKLIIFACVCLIQFLLMLSIGLVFLPMLGLPVLNLGNSYFSIFLVALACSFAATGYGVLVGTLASTQQQGAILGSLSILVLSALGGIWVPAYIMPDAMRSISELSPLHWALDGFYALFLRGGGMLDVLPHVGKLFLFFGVCIGLTALIKRAKQK